VSERLGQLETGMLFRRLNDAKQWSFPFLAKLTLTKFIQRQAGRLRNAPSGRDRSWCYVC
jgi:hypothetical protein